MKILLTGATSLIGRHVVSQLVQRGDQVTVLQRSASGLNQVAELRCDLAAGADDQPPGIANSVRETLIRGMQGKDAVIHLAAKVGVAGRWEAFESINVEGTRRVIEMASQCDVPRFIYVSSPSVAHAGKALVGARAGAADPVNVRGNYARSKALAEQIALSANGGAMKVVSLRPHLVWGPGDQQLVQRIVERAKAGRLMLVGNGQALIDTTYIDNAASAIVAGVDNIEQSAGHALVISNGQPRTVREIVERILTAAGLPAELKQVPSPIAIAAGDVIERVWDRLDRQDDPPMTRFMAEQLATAHWFDQRATQTLLKWQPQISLQEGFTRLAQSFQ